MRRFLATITLAAMPAMAVAHPHVFIDAAVSLHYDAQGRLVAVDVGWLYDDLYSLLVVEDLGLDPDGDGVLTPDETARLQGFDAGWDDDFAGDLYVLPAEGAAPVALARPVDFRASYRDGRILSTHRRVLETPLDGAAGAVVQVYDPSFYVDYTVAPRVTIRGRDDCRAVVYEPAPDAASVAYEMALAAALEETPGADPFEITTINIGAAGADEVRVSCGGR